MLEKGAGGIQPLELRLSGVTRWQVITALSLSLLYASWGLAVFRLDAAGREPGASAALVIFLAGAVFLPYSVILVLGRLRLNESIIRSVAGVLLLILIAGLPAVAYHGSQTGYLMGLRRYLVSLFRLETLFSPVFIATLLVVYLWRTGLTLSDRWIGPILVQRSLRLSTILMIASGLLAFSRGIPTPVGDVFLFTFSGLMAMGGARISSVGYLRGGGEIPFQRRDLTSLTLTAAILILSTLALVSVLGEPLAKYASRILAFLWLSFSWVVVVTLAPLFIGFLNFVGGLIGRLKPLLGTLEEEIAPVLTEFQTLVQETAENTDTFPFADRLGELLETAIPALVVVTILILVIAAIRRSRAATLWQNLNTDERKTLTGSFPASLLALLQGGAKSGLDALSGWKPMSRLIAAARIRQIYGHLLRESARLGTMREEAETPLEFLPRLELLFPGKQAELHEITGAYQRVRYGEYPESREQVDLVKAAWERVRHVSRSSA